MGLVLGVRPVEVEVAGAAAVVSFELDGLTVARVEKPPFRAAIDFGSEYTPHELVARAFGLNGREIGFARQWINLPRPAVEVEILLERDAAGKATAANLEWASRVGSKPTRVSVSFDGQPVEVDGSRRVVLPRYDASIPHVLSARVEFPGRLDGRADQVIGGGAEDTADSELTSIPIVTPVARRPRVDELEGHFQTPRKTLRVVAVEHEAALVVLVRDLSTDQEALDRYGPYSSKFGGEMQLPDGDGLQIIWPVADQVIDGDAALVTFDSWAAFEGRNANFLRALLKSGSSPSAARPRRFADAVAAAGVRAASTGSRRAVVLIVGAADWDHSRQSATSVRHYLESIHVPLYVWSLVPRKSSSRPLAAAWGEFEDVSTREGLRAAVSRLQEQLRRQSMVWLEGRHLPQAIMLVDPPDGVAFTH